jgi:hypothetical protein
MAQSARYTRYGLQGAELDFGQRDISLPQNAQNDPATHPISSSMGIVDSSSRSKAAGA